MNIAQLQRQIGVKDDGRFGPISRAAFLAHFSNRQAPAIDDWDIQVTAERLGCSALQLRAVRAVEASGRAYDREGRPIARWERQKFHRFTSGAFSPSSFSDRLPERNTQTWAQLMDAIATGEVDAAFQSASWGAFQVMGEWWDELGYPSPYALAWTCVQSEADQLELLVRYVECFRLQDELRAISSNPVSCRAFAAAYNGPAYRRNFYDERLANFMGKA